LSIPRIALFLSSLATGVQAQCPTWSDAFAAGGMSGAAKDFVVHDRGFGPRLVAAGQFSVEAGAVARGVAELADGRWRGFPEQLDADANAIVEFDAGQGLQLIVGGYFTQSSSGTPLNRVARWDGSAWAPLGSGFGEVVHALCVFDDGSGPKLYAAGEFQSSGFKSMSSIAVWNGSGWSNIGDVEGGPAEVYALEVFDDGNGPALYAGGLFSHAGGVPAANIARYDGLNWSALGAGTNERVRSLQSWLSPSGPRLVVGGRFSSAGGLSVNRIAAFDGTTWSTLAGGVSAVGFFEASVEKLTTLDLGSGTDLYAAGTFDTVDGLPGSHLARWNGTSWTSLGDSLVGEEPAAFLTAIEGVTLAGSTFLAISGGFESIGGVVGPDVARYDANGFGLLGAPNGGIQGHAYCSLAFDDGSGPSLFIGGSFRLAGGANANSITRFDGTNFHALGSGTTGDVEALAIYDDGSGPKLFAGGMFAAIGGVTTPGHIARWNGSAWEALSGGSPPTGSTGPITSLAVFDDGDGAALYAGLRTNVGTPRLARWRNGVWTPIFLPLNGNVLALAVHDLGTGPRLVLGGSFNNLAGQYMLGVGAFDGTSVVPISLGFTGVDGGLAFVEALHVHNDGSGAKLYAAGRFAAADLETAWGVARFDGNAWHALPGVGLTTSTGMEPGVGLALHTFDDGRGAGPALYVGGNFAYAGVVAAQNVARFDGSSWSALEDGIGSQLPPPTFTEVRMLGSLGSGADRQVVAGGVFSSAGTFLSNNVAARSACGETGRTFCFGDGSSTACPCGNASAVGERAGCLNSFLTGGALRGRGEASLANDTLILEGAQMTNSSALYFQGVNVSNGGLGTVFGDGITCVGGPFIRLGTKTNVSGASSFPSVGDLAVSVRGQVSAAVTRRYSVRYRNPAAFCTTDTFNYTNALEVVWRL